VEETEKMTGFQWYKNGEAVKLANLRTFSANDTGVYRVEVSFKDGCSVFSDEQKIFKNNAVLTISADGAQITSQCNNRLMSFTWIRDGIIVGSDRDAYLSDAVGFYRLIAIDEYGCELRSNEIYVGVTGENEDFEQSILVYPNPVKDFVWIDFGSEKTAKITVSDAIGRVLTETETRESKAKISTAHYPLGVYFMEITIGEKKVFVKLLKE
jgi:hypothetical protein